MAYEYNMVQLPPNISVDQKLEKGNEAAVYLQNLVNSKAQSGWEFHRVDTIGVNSKPGCLGALFGNKGEFTEYYVVTFRREA